VATTLIGVPVGAALELDWLPAVVELVPEELFFELLQASTRT
jgi:hypothetical protein